MRTVLKNHNEVCHIWASQSQETGRSGNISFDGDSIYSYGHWIIARFIDVDDKVVLFRDGSYSVSTAKHQGMAHNAVSHCRVFTVSSLDHPPNHQENINNYKYRMRELASKFWRSREGGKWLLDSYRDIVAEAKDYAEYFGQDLPPLFGLELSGPKAKAKLDKVNEFVRQREIRDEAERQRQEVLRERAVVIFAEREQKWLEGENVSQSVDVDGEYFYQAFSQDRLRVRPEYPNEIETSRGAYVSVRAAEILYRMIIAGKPVHGVKVGSYTVTGYNGALKVGCHTIERNEIDRFAKVMNWS